MEVESAIVLQLNSIDELFIAPSVNPFSTHEVDILGQTGIDVAQKRLLQTWPRRPRTARLTVQLPADQVTPDQAQVVRAALRRYCADTIDSNRLQRQLTIRRSLRQLIVAFAAILVALAFIAVLVANPLGLLPGFLRGILIVLALYACSVLSFDAVWSLVFDWVPFVQENAVLRVLRGMEIVLDEQKSDRESI